MAASTTAASAQRAIHARRARSRRGVPGSATAEGTRSSGDSEGKSEESEVTAGLVSSECCLLHPIAVTAFKNSATDNYGISRQPLRCPSPQATCTWYTKGAGNHVIFRP